MRTGVAYLGHHNPRHLRADLKALRDLGCDDVLLAAQENDFHYFPGKLEFLPEAACDTGLRPIALFWGALNLFGGGRSSQFLLEHPECQQVGRDGSRHAAGCYNNPASVNLIRGMIDRIAELGFAGYFIDEPAPLDCYCESCRRLFAGWYAADLETADPLLKTTFRRRCVIHYIEAIAGYVKQAHPRLETFCCLTAADRDCWRDAAAISSLDNLGTDLYWANSSKDLEDMRPLVRELAGLCRQHGKRHHLWLECWGVRRGREDRIAEQGGILSRERPDGLYVWAYEGQVGTSEACEDPERAWQKACEVLRSIPH